MAKRIHIMALSKNHQGQISIFFSASLMVFISIIAFVINVGLFVKAKINLQNATDAAAFSGAAVQARQLTKIAYLNWEMRNVYKEWMYKYYVVGTLNTPGVEDTSKSMPCGGASCTDFRLASDVNAISNNTVKDDYNFPATCIHIAGSKTNICKRFAVPGLPEFGGYNIPGTEEASRSFIDALIGSKVDDCVERSKLNMLVTTTWAYNVLTGNNDETTLAGRGPAILTDRQGAWPRAMEIAMRIRNLEKVVNRDPANKAVCIGGIGNCDPIHTYENESMMGNERIVKAFYSGYRNLGNASDSEMKNSFMLTELKPTPFVEQSKYSNSNLLIPPKSFYPKHYVDLKLMMVNLATFYAALIPRADSATSGACDISKVAIPVPGYPMGFYKNPDVVTYYAVKGEAEFEGMFNPFSQDKIKLTAFAAAKPMGGRIGPMLYTQKNNATVGRTDTSKYRSVPYISSLNVVGTPNHYIADGQFSPSPTPLAAGQFGPGVPLPINVAASNPFWVVNPTSPIGGLPDSGDVQFGIPNLVYDYKNPSDMTASSYSVSSSQMNVINTASPDSISPVGLYNHDQFLKFRGNLPAQISPDELNSQISRIRAATQYEAANYMIPTPNEVNLKLNVDSFGSISGTGTEVQYVNKVKKYTMEIYAPLYKEGNNQKDLLYENSTEVLATTVEFMRAQKPAIENYVHSLNSAAIQTYKTSFAGSQASAAARSKYKSAAEKISDIHIPDAISAIPADFYLTSFPKSCISLSGQFWHYYYGDPDLFPNPNYAIGSDPTCPIPLIELLRRYYSANPKDTSIYKMDYNISEENFPDMKRIFSAYTPGPYNGVSDTGTLVPPPGFPPNPEVMRRNFYSTKLIPLDSVQSGGVYNEKAKNFVIYSEGELTSTSSLDRSQGNFTNPINSSDLADIKY